MITIQANFENEVKTVSVLDVTRTGSFHLEDGTYISNHTIKILIVNPETVLHKTTVQDRNGDTLPFWVTFLA